MNNLELELKARGEHLYYITNGEVGFILKGKETIAVEVKYRSTISRKYLRNVLRVMQRRDIERGIVITKDEFKKEVIEDKELNFIPARLFLLAEEGG